MVPYVGEEGGTETSDRRGGGGGGRHKILESASQKFQGSCHLVEIILQILPTEMGLPSKIACISTCQKFHIPPSGS